MKNLLRYAHGYLSQSSLSNKLQLSTSLTKESYPLYLLLECLTLFLYFVV